MNIAASRGLTLAVVAVGIVMLSGCAQRSSYDPDILDGLHTDASDMAAITTCLVERDWDARLINGAIEVDVPVEQQERYESDSLECLRQTGIDPDAPLTDEQYRAIYEWSIEVADCLTGAGWSVPETPSFEVFRTTYETDPWLPWADVEGSDLGRAGEACPVLEAMR